MLAAVAAVLGIFSIWHHYQANPADDAEAPVILNRLRDISGLTDNVWNQAIRSCSKVETVPPASADWVAILLLLSDDSKFRKSDAIPLRVMRQGAWYMAEVKFSSLEPAIVIMERTPTGFFLETEFAWNGTKGPQAPGPLMRAHFRQNFPNAPDDLLRCFAPMMEKFRP